MSKKNEKDEVYKSMIKYKKNLTSKNYSTSKKQRGIISQKTILPPQAQTQTDQKSIIPPKPKPTPEEVELKRILAIHQSRSDIDSVFKLPESGMLSLPGNNNQRVTRTPNTTTYNFRRDFTENQVLNKTIEQCESELQNPDLYNDIDAFISHMRLPTYKSYSKYLFMKWFSSNDLIREEYKKYETYEAMKKFIWSYLNKLFYILFYIKIKNDLYVQYTYILNLNPRQKNILKIYIDHSTENFIIINKYIKHSRLNTQICRLIKDRTYYEYFFSSNQLEELPISEFNLNENEYTGHPAIPIESYVAELLQIFNMTPPLTEPLIVYRCNLNQDMEDELEHNHFLSTSLSKQYVLRFCEYETDISGHSEINGIISTYQIEPGNKILYLDTTLLPISIDAFEGENGLFHEMEILVNPNCNITQTERSSIERIRHRPPYQIRDTIPVHSFTVHSSIVARGKSSRKRMKSRQRKSSRKRSKSRQRKN